MLLDNFFSGMFSSSTLGISAGEFLICLAFALLAGFFNAWISTKNGDSSKSFTTTLAIIPAVVCMIIMMVNGNIGTGVAVAGAFSLVRFRSVPGKAREIGGIFVAMGCGISIGMGYIGFAVLFVLVVGIFQFILTKLPLQNEENNNFTLRVTVPENLNFEGAFDDLFLQHTKSFKLSSVKTSNMGSLYKLCYSLQLASNCDQKAFLDSIRCRNGNLEVAIMQDVSSCDKL